MVVIDSNSKDFAVTADGRVVPHRFGRKVFALTRKSPPSYSFALRFFVAQL